LALFAAIVSASAANLLSQSSYMIAHNHDNLIRLHVLANSDLPHDQELKLLVRDSLLPLLHTILEEQPEQHPDAVMAAVAGRQTSLVQKAAETIKAAGRDYPVRVELGYEEYPGERKSSFLLPAGRYRTVKVIIGEGKGKNWWCILFPPLCLVEQAGTACADAKAGSPAGATTAAAATADSSAVVADADRTSRPLQFRWAISRLLASLSAK